MKRIVSHGLLPLCILASLCACGTTGTHSTRSTTSTTAAQKTSDTEKSATEKRNQPVEASAARSSRSASSMSLAYPTGDESTSALLVEKFVPEEVIANQNFQYETVVRNLTAMPLDNVILTETMPSNFEMKSSEPKGTVQSGNVVWQLGNLGPREERTIRVMGTPKSAATIASCTSVSYNTALCTSIPVVLPALSLAAIGPAEVLECDEIVYKYVVTNTGSGNARDVVLNASLPMGLTVAGGTADLRKEVGNIEAGASKELTVKLKASQPGNYAHVATATGAGNLSVKASEVTMVVRRPVLKITKTGSETAYPGRDIKYQIIVTNTGDGVARDTVLTDTLPSGTKFNSATEDGRATSSQVRWNLGDLKPGESRTVDARYTTSKIGNVSSTAKAKAYCAADATVSVQTKVQGISAILLEVVDLEDPVEIDETVTYVITVTNQGTAAGHNIKIQFTPPGSMEFVSATGATSAPRSVAPGSAATFAPLAILDAKEKASWRVVLKGKKPDDARFRVAMTSDEKTSPIEETEATTVFE